MSTAVVPFQFQSSAIRTVTIDGEHWFVAKDVAEALGYTNTSKAISDHCRGVTKRYPIVDAIGRSQQARIIREPDLYRLIVGSTLPAAQEFEAWIFEEVLPALRRSGRYATADSTPNRRFIAHTDEDGRLTLTELKDEIVVAPKRLARMLADPAFRLAEGGDEHRAALLEIASVAMIRANYNANVARDLLFGDERERRFAAQHMARAATA